MKRAQFVEYAEKVSRAALGLLLEAVDARIEQVKVERGYSSDAEANAAGLRVEQRFGERAGYRILVNGKPVSGWFYVVIVRDDDGGSVEIREE